MNILYTNFHGDYGGGQDTYVRDLAAAMSRHHRVTVASPEGSRLSRLLKDSPDVAIFDMEFKPRWNRLWQEIVRLRQRIVAERFDVIHVNGSADHRQVMLALLGCRYRPAVVLTKHNTYRADSFGNVLRARLATDHTIAVSDYVAGMLALRSPYGNVTVVKHGVRRQAAERLASDEIRRRKIALFGPSAADAIVLGSSAGTAPEKGWMDLIAALGRLPEHERERFRVLLVGAEPTAEQREQIALHRMAARTAWPRAPRSPAASTTCGRRSRSSTCRSCCRTTRACRMRAAKRCRSAAPRSSRAWAGCPRTSSRAWTAGSSRRASPKRSGKSCARSCASPRACARWDAARG